MQITVKEVARESGVSPSTVSRVINDDPRISSETKEKVLKTIEKLGYKPNTFARSLKTKKSYTVGFIVPELTNDFFMGIAKGFENVLNKYGYSMLVCDSGGTAEGEKKRIEFFCEKQVDGLLVIPSTNEGNHFSLLNDTDIPMVLADRVVENFITDAVLVDNINGIYNAVEYLIKKGRRRIGFIGGDLSLTTARERFEGYKRVLDDYCIQFEEEIVRFGDFHGDSGYKLMQELAELQQPPEDVFVSNFFMHIGAVKYLINNRDKLKYPIQLANFDDMELSSILGFSTVRVRQPLDEIGQRAAKLLIKRMEGDKTDFPAIERLKTSLVTS